MPIPQESPKSHLENSNTWQRIGHRGRLSNFRSCKLLSTASYVRPRSMHPVKSTSGSGVTLLIESSIFSRLGPSARTTDDLICKYFVIFHRLVSNGTRKTTIIEPVEMRPILPYKGPPGYDDEGSTEASTTDEGLQLSKLIDWTVALVSIATERNLIGKAFGQINMWLGSLNQTFGPYGDCACFMELEVKKTQAARDSRLQIATWASAGIKKKNFHDWDTSFPMPAITVDGHK